MCRPGQLVNINYIDLPYSRHSTSTHNSTLTHKHTVKNITVNTDRKWWLACSLMINEKNKKNWLTIVLV